MTQADDTLLTTTEYQPTVLDPNLGEAAQVQCANCGGWRPNSRIYCPICGARNVVAQSQFLTEEEVISRRSREDEARASVREPAKDLQRKLILGGLLLALVMLGAFWWLLASRQPVQIQREEPPPLPAVTLPTVPAPAATPDAVASSPAFAGEAAPAASAPQAEVAVAPMPVDTATAAMANRAAAARKPAKPLVVPPVAPAPEPVAVAPPPKAEALPVAAAAGDAPLEKLQAALAVCKSKGGFFERNACEFDARKRYCKPLEGKVRECPFSRENL